MTSTDDLPSKIRDRKDLEVLLARATNYEEWKPRSRVRPVFKLDRVAALLASVGDPHLGGRTVHVAGSKGKGTVARMVDAALREAERGPVGLYTSPHLEDLSERVAVNGRPASDDELARAADGLLPHVRRVLGTPQAITFFELLTAMAWWIFREQGCTDVVLETGLGGRLDATNVCRPDLVLITSIELEHTDVLGTTIEAVAAEKAGILKPDTPAGTTARGAARSEIERHATRVGVPLTVVGRDVLVKDTMTGPGPETRLRVTFPDASPTLDLCLGVAGIHHAENAALAAWAARQLGVPPSTTKRALEQVRLPGILEALGSNPLVVADGAHTPVSAHATRAAVDACWPARRRVLLVALLEGKDADAIARALAPGAAHVVTTRLPTPRTMDEGTLATAFAKHVPAERVEAVPDPSRALDAAEAAAGAEGLVLATGSVRLAGLVRARLRTASRG